MVIEFKKTDVGPGPPLNIRLSGHDVETLASTHEFEKMICEEIGEFNYLLKLHTLK